MKFRPARAAATVALLALLVPAAPVAAAEPLPDGVVADATVTVTVTTGTDVPVAGAFVTLDVADGSEVLFSWNGVTGEDGSVTFADVWRPDSGGPALQWTATASWSETKYGSDAGLAENCRVTQSLDGSATTAAVAGPATIAIAADPASSAQCGPPLVGSVVDADGAPFDVAEAFVRGVDDKDHVWIIPFDVAADGSFEVLAPPTAEMTFFVRSSAFRDVVRDDGCTYSLYWVVDQTMSPDPEFAVELIATEQPLASSCVPPDPNETDEPVAVPGQTPPFTGGGPAVTPPATDTSESSEVAPASVTTVLAVIGVVASIVLLALPRGRGRGVRRTQ